MEIFERQQRKHHAFNNHLITAALCRLDFQPLFGFENIVGKFQKRFVTEFPISKVGYDLGYDIDISDRKEPKISTVNGPQIYELANSDHGKKIKFSNTSLILEYYKYIGFNPFRDTFSNLLEFIFQNGGREVVTPTRLGLRKINQHIILGNNVSGFDDFFNDFLTKHFKMPFVNESMDQDKHYIRFQVDDIFGVNLQYGSDLGKQEEKDARRFILDIDVYTQNLSNDCDDIKLKFEKMNELLFDVFFWSINNKMINYLKEKRA